MKEATKLGICIICNQDEQQVHISVIVLRTGLNIQNQTEKMPQLRSTYLFMTTLLTLVCYWEALYGIQYFYELI